MAPPWVFVPRGEQEHIYGHPLQCFLNAFEKDKKQSQEFIIYIICIF